jgi:hypothetical protein
VPAFLLPVTCYAGAGQDASWCGTRSKALLGPRVPGGPGRYRLPVALAASEALADLRDHGRVGQGVAIDVGRSVTALARRRDCANAFLAHVRQAHERAGRDAHQRLAALFFAVRLPALFFAKRA